MCNQWSHLNDARWITSRFVNCTSQSALTNDLRYGARHWHLCNKESVSHKRRVIASSIRRSRTILFDLTLHFRQGAPSSSCAATLGQSCLKSPFSRLSRWRAVDIIEMLAQRYRFYQRLFAGDTTVFRNYSSSRRIIRDFLFLLNNSLKAYLHNKLPQAINQTREVRLKYVFCIRWWLQRASHSVSPCIFALDRVRR